MLILLILALSLLLVIYKAIPNDGFLKELADADKAHGVITFFFAIGTVGVAIILTAAAFAISGDNKEEMRERFDMGKQVLTALIGIFGTILGFYFGSLDQDGDQGGLGAGNGAVQTETPEAPANGDQADDAGAESRAN